MYAQKYCLTEGKYPHKQLLKETDLDDEEILNNSFLLFQRDQKLKIKKKKNKQIIIYLFSGENLV
jgi:hypothetical protein